MLILMAARRGAQSEVILSEGELVQIGAGELPNTGNPGIGRHPTARSRNHQSPALEDYRRAIGDTTVMILGASKQLCHDGLRGLSPLKHWQTWPGNMTRWSSIWEAAHWLIPKNGDIDREIAPAEAIHQGVDLVCFGGDKLMGGPQAGIIAGNTTHQPSQATPHV